MQSIALVSGLIGALLSAAFSFLIRWYLDDRAQRQAELKISYVHYLAVSDLLVAEDLMLRFFGALGLTERYARLASREGEFEPSHKASALISEAIHAASVDSLQSPRQDAVNPRLLKRMLESLKGSSLSSEVMSKLPRDTIQCVSRLQSALAQVGLCLEMWNELAEKGDRSWVNPDVIHDHWLTVRRFLDAARALKTSFIRAGVVSSAEAREIHRDQLTYQARHGFARILNENQLAAAAKAAATNDPPIG